MCWDYVGQKPRWATKTAGGFFRLGYGWARAGRDTTSLRPTASISTPIGLLSHLSCALVKVCQGNPHEISACLALAWGIIRKVNCMPAAYRKSAFNFV